MGSDVLRYMVCMCCGRKLCLSSRNEFHTSRKTYVFNATVLVSNFCSQACIRSITGSVSPIEPTCPHFNRKQSDQPLIIKPRPTHHDQNVYRSPLCPCKSLFSLQKPLQRPLLECRPQLSRALRSTHCHKSFHTAPVLPPTSLSTPTII